MFQSPFLDANPAYASLLTSAEPSRQLLPDGEYVSIVLYDMHGHVRYQGPRISAKAKIDFSAIPYARVGFAKPTKAYLDFWLVFRGKVYRSFRRVTWIYHNGGFGVIPPKDYGAAMNASRRAVQEKVKLPPGKRTDYPPHNSGIRPNPQIKTKVRQNFTEGNNGGYFFSPTTSVETIYTRTWSGVNTPGFAKLPKNQRPVNPHSVFIEDVADKGLIEMYDIPSTGIYFNEYSSFTRRWAPPAAASHDSKAASKAIKKLVARMESEMDSNLAQDVAQIRQTVKLVADTAQRLARSGLALKNGNFLGAARALWGSRKPYYGGKNRKPPSPNQSTANNWLALQYGWKPLLQDLHGAFEACARMHLADASIKQVTASASTDVWVVDDLFLPTDSSKVCGWTRVRTQSRVKYGVKFTVDNHLLAFLAQTGFTNPVNLLWEVIPFSFVVDWFLPIGPWLEGLSNFHGLVFFDGYQTSFTKQTVESNVRFGGPIGPSAPGQNLQMAGDYELQRVLLNRDKLVTFPSSSFPTWKNPLSVDHALNALALLKTVFR